MNKANSKDLPTTLKFTRVLDVVAEMQGAYAPFIDKIKLKNLKKLEKISAQLCQHSMYSLEVS
jgi:hypothetical protein